MASPNYAAMLATGQVVNHYQPIVDLRTGTVLGIEVLTRMTDGERIIPPGMFLPALTVVELGDLLFFSLARGLATLSACAATHPLLSISFNVSPALLLQPGFHEDLLSVLSLTGTDRERITLEVLEDDEFLNLDTARAQLVRLHEAGLRIALDDVGNGYSSLARMRDLPVQAIKLDQGFVRNLQRQPENLQFVAAMQSLARGLRTELVVEGVETDEILDALGIMGIGAAQGYAIARPMPDAALVSWLAAHVPHPAARQPTTLLAAYAAHLGIVEACRALMNQPLRAYWAHDVRDPHVCSIGRFFDARRLHDTEFGLAHKHFHTLIDCYDDNPQAWEKAASTLWRTLQEAIRRDAARAENAARAAELVDVARAAKLDASHAAAPKNMLQPARMPQRQREHVQGS